MRERIDKLMVDRGLVQSRDRAQRLIMAGAVRVAGQVVAKAGTAFELDCDIEVQGDDIPFVSRGGLKLARALDAFQVDVSGAVVLDVGASTGGFTDCVLQRGARSVIAIDVGYGQFDWKLRNDPRVTLLERTNIRTVEPEQLPTIPDLVVVDVSFISLALVLPVLARLVAPGCKVVALVKPQFEVGKGQVGKGGVVRDPEQRRAVLLAVRAAAEQVGFEVRGECESPLIGPKGNHEFFLHLVRRHD